MKTADLNLIACGEIHHSEPAPAALRPPSRMLVVILNFNGIEDTLACLESLSRQACQDFSVQVIDNGSRADDLGRIASRFPQTEIIALPRNLGWAGGNNIGMQAALDRGFGCVCLLNNDTILDRTAIGELLTALSVLGQPALLHPAIACFDEPAKWQVNPEPSRRSGGAVPDREAALDIVEMDWAYGACLVMPASVVRTVGWLDERFFLQLEETDYYNRARSLGIRSFCARRARLLHKESASFGGRITEAKTYYQVRNSFLLAEKHTPGIGGYLRTARCLMWALHNQANARGAGLTGWPGLLRWLLSAEPLARAARQGMRDYVCRRFGRRPGAERAS
jgi:GT2 family glycosyltransferase